MNGRENKKNKDKNFKTLVEDANDGILIAASQKNHMYVNKKACQMTGYSKTELLNSSIKKLVHPDEYKKIIDRFKKRLRGDTAPQIYETVFVNKKGKNIPIELTASRIEWEGKPANMVFIRNITERKRAEEELQKNKERYRTTLSSMSDMIFVLDSNDRFVDSHFSPDSLLYALPEEFLGKKIGEILPSYLSESYIEFSKKLRESGEIQQFEYPLQIGDENRWYISTLDLHKDGNQVVVSVKDITERKKVEEEWRKSEERLYSFINSASDSFYLLDSNLNLVEINKRGLEVIGKVREEVVGKHITEIVPDIESSGRLKKHKEVLKTGRPFFAEHFRSHPLFGGRHFVLKSFKVGEGLGIISIDITDLKRAEDLVCIQRDLGVSLGKAIDFHEVLRLCLRAGMEASEMDCGGIYIVDPATRALDLFYHEGLPEEFVTSVTHYEADSLNAQMVMAGDPIYSNHKILGVPLKMVEDVEELKAIAVIPVKHTNRVVGCLNVSSHIYEEVPQFARNTLETIISQIGDAIANRQAEEALQKSEEKYRKMFELSPEAIVLTDNRGKILDVNERLSKLANCKKEELIGKLFFDLPILSKESKTRVFEVFSKRMEGHETFPYEVEFISKKGEIRIGLGMATLIKDKDGKIVQNLVMISDITERKKTEEEILKSREELRALSAHLESIREEERANISREIHDELGQALTALKIDLNWLKKRLPILEKSQIKKTENMIKLIDKTFHSVKRISSELRPGLLDDLGLSSAIEWQSEEFKKRTGIHCDLNISPEEIEIVPKLAIIIFRIFQETLTNISRHAQATRIEVRLEEKQGKLTLKVKDNGIGITEEQMNNPTSYGIIGMRERVRMFDGNLSIKGIPKRGTTVTVEFFISKNRDD